MTYDEQVRALEIRLDWTLDNAADCGCNMREEPCDRCWDLGWAIGGITEREKNKDEKK